ncbi:HNH endonuclease signature motif containing protein [Microbacterium cremeum]|uniref:HNH endonuclease signature motif containing protein n=1 Tax=Microbacterium cremeum TaxID=2782169 RepID=UPI001887E793|nr:HNH endonuclease signature motif containing protein [Microbacterium cremeum]
MPADPAFDPTSAFAAAGRLVDGFETGRRARAAADAAEIRLLADAAAAVSTPAHASIEHRRRSELARRALVSDLATSSRVSERTIIRLLSESADLCARFAPAVEALERGDLSRQHLAVIHDIGDPIDDDQARDRFVRIAVDRAATLTPGRLAPVLKVIAERFVERSLEERHAAAVARRDVRVIDQADGLATLELTHEAALIHGIHDRLTAQAHSVVAARVPGTGTDADADTGTDTEADTATEFGTSGETEGAETEGAEPVDERTMDQLRADIATDLLLTAGPDDCVAGTGLDAIRATVQVTVPVLTMTGASTEPALLAGYGPIDTETARALAAGAPGWERVMTSPVTGAVLCVDRYRPGPALDRFLAARDERCRFPGCRMPVWRCDVDHTVGAAQGGPTHHANLAHLCRRHHVLKTVEAWTVAQTAPGVLVWTSTSGRKHTDRPDPVVRFLTDPEILDRRRVMKEPWLFAPEDPPGTSPPF